MAIRIQETSTTCNTQNLPERGGEMEFNKEFDMRKVMTLLVTLLAEQEGLEVDFTFKKREEVHKEETA